VIFLKENEQNLFLIALITLLLVSVSLIFLVAGLKGGENFTELYFEGGSVLGTVSSGSEHSLVFEISNQEGRPVLYSFTVLLDNSVVSRGSAKISSGSTEQFSEPVIFSSAGTKLLKVRIDSPKLIEISQWVSVE